MGNIPQDALDVIAKENKMRITDELRRQSRSHEIDSLREYAVEQGYTVPEFTKTKETLEAEMLEAGKLVVIE